MSGAGVLALGDPLQLVEMLINIVTNAYDAMKGGGRLLMAARSEGDGTVIIVEDTGPGVDADVSNRVFEPFVTTKQRGTGLGLAIVQRIADTHGGSVSIDCERESGTRVTVTLPSPHGRCVLVVDDEADVREAIAEILRTAGYFVTEAEDGDIALHLLSGATADVVVLDIDMPGRGGLSALSELPDGPPVVLVTGEALEEEALRHIYRGVMALLRKPVPSQDLLRAVAKAIQSAHPALDLAPEPDRAQG